jgi:hypothetical protein
VSLDPFSQSDLVPGPEELNVVKAQLARLGSQCRIFAPMYRQFSLGALRARMSGGGDVPVRGTPADANNDVDDAWDWYMANENKGRGVVILGHSQGSGQIMRLIAAKVDGKPAQGRWCPPSPRPPDGAQGPGWAGLSRTSPSAKRPTRPDARSRSRPSAPTSRRRTQRCSASAVARWKQFAPIRQRSAVELRRPRRTGRPGTRPGLPASR